MSPLCFVPHRAKAGPCSGGRGQELDLHSPAACAPGRGPTGSQEREPGCPEGPRGCVDAWWCVGRRRVCLVGKSTRGWKLLCCVWWVWDVA